MAPRYDRVVFYAEDAVREHWQGRLESGKLTRHNTPVRDSQRIRLLSFPPLLGASSFAS